MNKKYIVVWASYGIDPESSSGSVIVNRLTEKKDGKYVGAKIFTSLSEAMRTARKDREKFISEEKDVHGDDINIELTSHKRWLAAKSAYVTITWAVIEL